MGSPLPPADSHWKAGREPQASLLGWNTITVDGHDLAALLTGFAAARGYGAGPTVLLADTIPGRGVTALEGRKAHFAKLPPDVAAQALLELEG